MVIVAKTDRVIDVKQQAYVQYKDTKDQQIEQRQLGR